MNCIRFVVPADPCQEPPSRNSGGMNIEPKRVLGEVKIDPWRVPGAPWGLLCSSGGLLEARAGFLGSSRRGFGGVPERPAPFLEAFWELLGPSWGLIGIHNGARWESKRLGNGAAGACCYRGAASSKILKIMFLF